MDKKRHSGFFTTLHFIIGFYSLRKRGLGTSGVLHSAILYLGPMASSGFWSEGILDGERN